MKMGLSLVTFAAFAAVQTSALADEASVWRLFVADHAASQMRAIDIETGRTLSTFALRSPATLYATDSGRTVFAVQRDGNVVSAISSGIAVGDHGDHGDLDVDDPEELGLEVEGERPVHFVDHGGNIALFFDGEGVARILSEKAAHEGAPRIREARTSAPHHGVAVAWGEHVIVSEPDVVDPSNLPVGVRVVDADGHAGDVHACPGLHGEAGSGNLIAIACETGLLLVSSGPQGPTIEHLPYPASIPEGSKVSTLVGGKGLQYFLGNLGPSAVVLIDPQDTESFRRIELPTRRVHVAVDPIRPKFAYVFTEDGQLHRLNVLSGRISESLRLTEPYSMDGHWSDPRPRIAVTGGAIAITDPLAGLVHLVDAETFERAGEIAVEGKPFSMLAVGGSGVEHD
jgi:hypothetical protein